MGFYQFGDRFLKDAPTRVFVVLKDDKTIDLNLDDEHGLVFNPGEPLMYCQAFFPPTGDRVMHLRVLQVISWESVKTVNMVYPDLSATDPSVWVQRSNERLPAGAKDLGQAEVIEGYVQ